MKREWESQYEERMTWKYYKNCWKCLASWLVCSSVDRAVWLWVQALPLDIALCSLVRHSQCLSPPSCIKGYSPTSIIRTLIIQSLLLSGLFLWSHFIHEHQQVIISTTSSGNDQVCYMVTLQTFKKNNMLHYFRNDLQVFTGNLLIYLRTFQS